MGSVSQYPNVENRIKVRDVAQIVSLMRGSELPGQLRYAVERYLPEITEEFAALAALREADTRHYAQRCLLFAICSPQCDFDTNVRVARRAHSVLYDDFDDVEGVYQAITANSSDSWFLAGSVARSIWHNLEWLRNVSESDMNGPSLRALRKAGTIKGLGPKTTAMAVALFDAGEDVYTLDVHMLRGILRAVGMDDRLATGQYITNGAYPVLEAACVNLHKELFGDEVPVFVSQWAVWNHWRSGEFISHLAIFA